MGLCGGTSVTSNSCSLPSRRIVTLTLFPAVWAQTAEDFSGRSDLHVVDRQNFVAVTDSCRQGRRACRGTSDDRAVAADLGQNDSEDAALHDDWPLSPTDIEQSLHC